MSETVTVILRQAQNYHFETEFGGGLPAYATDEPAPLGTGLGPSPTQMLLTAVGSCMSSSFHFAMSKFHEAPGQIVTKAAAAVGRNENNRLRVLSIDVAISFAMPAASIGHMERIAGQFEQFCTVGASVAQGIPIHVTVTDGEGKIVKDGPV
ncbi:MAG TPA: OsmC family protein [Acidocella sp.]|jgi:uncharacterized OsmC-like protein|nr:OsmC family protein [Acidocella sp.]